MKKEPIESLEDIYAKSNLFGYVFDVQRFPRSDTEKIKILSPSYPDY